MYDDAYPLWDGTDYTDNVKEKEMTYELPAPALEADNQKFAFNYYTATQMQEAYAAGRLAGLEEAAKVCEDKAQAMVKSAMPHYGTPHKLRLTADAIRNLASNLTTGETK